MAFPVMNTADATTHAEPAGRRHELQLRQARERQWFMLVLAIVVIAAAFILRFGQGSGLRLPWTGVTLPPLCTSRLLFGIECPGCGLTRSFVALASGDFAGAWHYNRVGWLLALAVMAQIPYRVWRLRQLNHGIVAESKWPVWFGSLLIAALIVNWVLKVLGV
jgi:hypothetical protein